MDALHGFGLREAQQVVAAREPPGPCGEAFAAVLLLAEAVLLDHRAEAAVEQQDALPERLDQIVHFFTVSIS